LAIAIVSSNNLIIVDQRTLEIEGKAVLNKMNKNACSCAVLMKNNSLLLLSWIISGNIPFYCSRSLSTFISLFLFSRVWIGVKEGFVYFN